MESRSVPVTTYLVTGPTAYMGYRPGETFEADLDPAAEQRALERGNIKKVTPKKKEEESDA
jgi:hypothetical protein